MTLQVAPPVLPTPWRDAELPRAWPDYAKNLPRLLSWLFKVPLGRFELAEVPKELELDCPVPRYAREAFHGLPNGYYSVDVVEGYDRGFEFVMLGRVQKARERMVLALRGAQRALDVGCGSGRLAHTMLRAGIGEVWGIDPSPYMLQRAVRRSPGACFTQGLIEATHFPDAYFDGAGACFLFHELPREIAGRALDELARVLRPGAVLCITDPCREHLAAPSRWRLLREHGLSALYFHVLARLVYEPFLEDWHSIEDYGAWFDAHGFELIDHDVTIPFGALVAKRR